MRRSIKHVKPVKKYLAVLLVLAVLPAQAGWFEDDDDFVAICKTKALKIKSKVGVECATGDDQACEAQEAIINRTYDEDGCKAISIAHRKYTK